VIRLERQRRRRQAGRRIGAHVGIAIALLCAPFIAAAASAKTSGRALPALFTNSEAAQGRIVFEQHCAACQGDELRGKIGPALIGPSLERDGFGLNRFGIPLAEEI
jgi:mono/diheme cytochrome c family protein